MHKLAAVVLSFALVIAACGDDDDSGSPDPASDPVTTTSVVSLTLPTAPAPDPSQTTEAPDPVVEPTDPPAPPEPSPEDAARALRIAGAALLAGEWSGQWNNTTFGSSGPIEATITVNSDAGFLLADLDVGGSVFGQEDPDPQTFELDLVVGPPYDMRSGLLGEFDIEIADDGSFTLAAGDVAAEGIASMTITGSITPTSFSATYTITFEGGGGAEGTIEATKG
jgi:hypothetical protein